jgi:hypothetical protein
MWRGKWPSFFPIGIENHFFEEFRWSSNKTAPRLDSLLQAADVNARPKQTVLLMPRKARCQQSPRVIKRFVPASASISPNEEKTRMRNSPSLRFFGGRHIRNFKGDAARIEPLRLRFASTRAGERSKREPDFPPAPRA